jgi:hypothetical protein
MPPVGFELTISAGERTQQTYALDPAAAETGESTHALMKIKMSHC